MASYLSGIGQPHRPFNSADEFLPWRNEIRASRQSVQVSGISMKKPENDGGQGEIG